VIPDSQGVQQLSGEPIDQRNNDRRAHDAASVQRAQVDAEQGIEKRVEVRRKGSVVKEYVDIQAIAGQYACRHVHLTPVVDDRMRPALPCRGEHRDKHHRDDGSGDRVLYAESAVVLLCKPRQCGR
jgi:hypothetical protein